MNEWLKNWDGKAISAVMPTIRVSKKEFKLMYPKQPNIVDSVNITEK